jgi:(p)ppGpp synthase/HD superfamily hydrolase
MLITDSSYNLIHEAIIYAALKHENQKRKGTNIPYITHPMEVMQILTENNCSNVIIAAGILHDIIEDAQADPTEILELFGERILKIVVAESENKKKSWKERKQATIDHLPTASLDVKLVCCADKLANLRSMAADKKDVGDKLWKRFNASKEDISWYYMGIIKALRGIDEYPMYRELRDLYVEVFEK